MIGDMSKNYPKRTKLEMKHLDFLENEFSIKSIEALASLPGIEKKALFDELFEIEIGEVSRNGVGAISQRGKIAVEIADYLHDNYCK